MADLTPEIEGKYEILEKIQVGGMGAIYKVRHRLLGDVRVIKVLRPQLSQDVAFQKRFHREAKAATRLTHPNIARLYDFSIDETGTAYIVMEYIEGWTLDDLVVRGELPPIGLALEIARQSLRALGHLHANGVIHRDISPDNLMLTQDVDARPAVKLIDLGLVKSVTPSEDLTASGVFVGKFRYAAPEHFRRDDDGPQVGPASDLYSFGLVLYELLTGRYPILGDTATALIAGHLYHPPLDFSETDPAGRLSNDLRRLVMRAIAKVPDERFTSAEEMAAECESIARRYEVTTPEARNLLALTTTVRRQDNPRSEKPGLGSTQSRLDQQFGTEPTPLPAERATASIWISRIESRIGEGDFTAAREELRQARESEGEVAALVELRQRIDEIENISQPDEAAAVTPSPAPPLLMPPPPPPASPPVAQEVPEEVADEAAVATTTPLQVPSPAVTEAFDEAALAPTEILPTVKSGQGFGAEADIRAQLETRPHAGAQPVAPGELESRPTEMLPSQAPPPSAPPMVTPPAPEATWPPTPPPIPSPAPPPPTRAAPAPAAFEQRSFDEMSIQMTIPKAPGQEFLPAPKLAPEPEPAPPHAAPHPLLEPLEPLEPAEATAGNLPIASAADDLPLGSAMDDEEPWDNSLRPDLPDPSRSSGKLALTVVLLIVVFLLIGFALARFSSDGRADGTIEDEEIGSASLSRGVVVIETKPQAKVERIVDEGGRSHSVPEANDTPVTLELEAGTYTVTLYYPTAAKRVEIEARVVVGERARISHIISP